MNNRPSDFLPIRRQWEQQNQGGGGQPTTNVAATPLAAAAAPASASSAEVEQAQQDLRRQSLRKRGFTSTIYAGDTGGYQGLEIPSPTNPKVPAPGSNVGVKTLGGA